MYIIFNVRENYKYGTLHIPNTLVPKFSIYASKDYRLFRKEGGRDICQFHLNTRLGPNEFSGGEHVTTSLTSFFDESVCRIQVLR